MVIIGIDAHKYTHTVVAVDGALGEPAFDRGEPLLDAAPAARDEIDEERQVVDACVPLGEGVPLDPLQPADDLVHEAAHLGEVPRARPEVAADAVLDRFGQARFELGRRRRERLDRGARPLERGIEVGRLGACLEPLLGAGDRVFVHGGDDTNCGGWTSTSSTTTFRRS